MRALQKCWLATALLLGTLTGAAHAIPVITYTESAIVSGTIGSVAFTGASLVITGANGNPASVVANPNPNDPFIPFFFTNASPSTSFSLTGVGTGSFTGDTFWFSNQDFFSGTTSGSGGFAVKNVGTVLATLSDAFTNDNYRLATSYGPIVGDPFFRDDVNFATSLGALRFSAAGSATFQAVMTDVTPVPVPEPGSLGLLSISMIGLLAARRRRNIA